VPSTQASPGRSSQRPSICVDAHHKALAKETSREWGCQTQADPWQTLQERGNAPKLASTASGGSRRPYSRRAPPGFRRRVWAEGLNLHHREGHSRAARRRMAAQKKSQIASEQPQSATKRRGGCGDGWLAASTQEKAGIRGRVGLQNTSMRRA
jgi:hypothetical protein